MITEDWSRRDVLEAGVAGGLLGSMPAASQEALLSEAGRQSHNVKLEVNGQQHVITVDGRRSLLELIREDLGLTGTKRGCDHGQCGACTIIVDGRRVNSCLTFAIMFDGASVRTIEGMAKGRSLNAMQAAFVECDAFQCGFCTPGQICSAVAMLDEMAAGWPSYAGGHVAAEPALSDAEIRERMSGNICRCGAYPNIVAAIRVAGGKVM